jgi:hypothetical protein
MAGGSELEAKRFVLERQAQNRKHRAAHTELVAKAAAAENGREQWEECDALRTRDSSPTLASLRPRRAVAYAPVSCSCGVAKIFKT